MRTGSYSIRSRVNRLVTPIGVLVVCGGSGTVVGLFVVLGPGRGVHPWPLPPHYRHH